MKSLPGCRDETSTGFLRAHPLRDGATEWSGIFAEFLARRFGVPSRCLASARTESPDAYAGRDAGVDDERRADVSTDATNVTPEPEFHVNSAPGGWPLPWPNVVEIAELLPVEA